MNFGMIFLCLLIGAIVGFEVGKYMATKKIQEFLSKIAEEMKQVAEKQKAEAEQKKKEAVENLGKIFSMIKESGDMTEDQQKANALRCAQNSIYGITMAKMAKSCAEGDMDGDAHIELGRQKFRESLDRMKNMLDKMEEDEQ